MARHNTEAQVSLVPQPEDAPPKDSEVGDNADDDEVTAGLLNSASAKKKAMETKSRGFFGSFSIPGISFNRATRSTAQAAQVAQDQSSKEDGDKPPNMGDIMAAEPAADPEALNLLAVLPPAENGLYPKLPEESLHAAIDIPPPPPPSEVPAPVPVPIQSSPSRHGEKRKLRDIYDPSDHEEVGEADKEVEKLAKRTRSIRKAKQPLGAAKQSNGKPLQIPSSRGFKSLKAAAQTIVDPPATENSDRASLDANTAANGVTNVKRKPGRPKGKKVQSSAPDMNETGTIPLEAEPRIYPAPGSVEGVSSILMNPSPIKVNRPNARPGSSKATNNAEADDEFPDLPDINSHRAREDTSEKSIAASEASFHFDNGIVNFDLLESMLEKIKHVGHTFLVKEKKWELKRRVKLYSTCGKQLNKKLVKLTSLFTELRSLDAENDSDDMHTKHAAITSLLNGIKEDVKGILSKRLGNPALDIAYFDAASTRTILVDLYFNIFPKFLGSIKLGAEAYYEHNTIETSLLEELADLVECFYSLAKIATTQPKTMQPKPKNIQPQTADYFHISQPTRQIMPLLREFHSAMKDELGSRAEVEDAARRSQAAQKHREERLEKELNEREEKRRQKKAILKMQRQDLDRQLNERYWGKFLREDIERYNATAAAKEALKDFKLKAARHSHAHQIDASDEGYLPERRKRRTRITRRDTYEVDDEEADDPFEDHISEARVSGVFGTNNKQQNGSEPWSDERKAEFLQFLCAHDEEEDRFERLAKKFQCTMDEIFDYAKDVQDAMDDAHENGRLTGPEDEWTYRVWEEIYPGSRGR